MNPLQTVNEAMRGGPARPASERRTGPPASDDPSQGPAIPRRVASQQSPLPFRQTPRTVSHPLSPSSRRFGLAPQTTRFASRFQLPVPLGLNRLGAALQLVLRRHVTDGTVQTLFAVVRHKCAYGTLRLFQARRRLGTDALSLHGPVPPLQLPVRLRVVRARSHMRHAADLDELFAIPSDELRSVVRDNPRRSARELFLRPLQDQLDIHLLHRLPDLPVDHIPTESVQDPAQVVKGAADIDVTDVDVPVFVRLERLHKSGPLLRCRAGPRLQHPLLLQHPIHRARTRRCHTRVDHHERHPPISLARMAEVEPDDRIFLPRVQPPVPWNQAVVLVGLPIPLDPVVVLAPRQFDPSDHPRGGDFRLLRPVPDEIDHLVPCVRRGPPGSQLSPRLFFSFTCSSRSSAMTESFLASFFSAESSLDFRFRSWTLSLISKARFFPCSNN